MGGWACSASLRAPVLCQARGAKTKQQRAATEREEEAALRRRLLRRPVVLTTHARERLQGRQVVAEEVQAVLRYGTLNRRMSQFGGKPSPVYVFEAELQPQPASQAAAAATAAAAGGSELTTEEATAEAAAEAAAEAGGQAGYTAAAASPASQRRLRVVFAAREDATVVLTAVDLEGSD